MVVETVEEEDVVVGRRLRWWWKRLRRTEVDVLVLVEGGRDDIFGGG